MRIVDTADVDGQPSSLVQATWLGNAQTTASQDLVEDLRAVPAPDGATALVGGASAQTVDLIDSVFDRLPWMAAFVAVVMLVLLFLAFGSVVLPVKAIVMNLLSIAAAFGVVTWIFQDGHLSGLLGFTSPGYLDVTQPILMLAILFGLSMDYEVFLLSRVREEWDRTGDNTAAVALGLQRTGRIITSAALLLAVVIGGFATSGIVFLKMIGVGMLVAVLLDATVVRALLVPATMRLLGRFNWWAPAPMARWWERHGHREEPLPVERRGCRHRSAEAARLWQRGAVLVSSGGGRSPSTYPAPVTRSGRALGIAVAVPVTEAMRRSRRSPDLAGARSGGRGAWAPRRDGRGLPRDPHDDRCLDRAPAARSGPPDIGLVRIGDLPPQCVRAFRDGGTDGGRRHRGAGHGPGHGAGARPPGGGPPPARRPTPPARRS